MAREMQPFYSASDQGKPGREAPLGGPRPGVCCGIICMIFMVSFFMDVCAFAVTTFGQGGYNVVPVPTPVWNFFDAVPTTVSNSTAATRELQYWGDWEAAQAEAERRRQEDEDARKQAELLNAVIGLGALLLQCVTALVYWRCYIIPTYDKFLPPGAKAPANLRGKWLYEWNDCFSATGTCCCFLWCTFPTLADLYFRSGWIHRSVSRSTDAQAKCKGLEYLYAFIGLIVVNSVTSSCCFCCIQSFMRNGFRTTVGQQPGGYNEFGDIRSRFEIPANGCNTFCSDCCLWCWCGPCAGTQEYRHVMHLLDNGYESPQVAVGQVVGVPIAVGQPVAGETGAEEAKPQA